MVSRSGLCFLAVSSGAFQMLALQVPPPCRGSVFPAPTRGRGQPGRGAGFILEARNRWDFICHTTEVRFQMVGEHKRKATPCTEKVTRPGFLDLKFPVDGQQRKLGI